MLRIARLSFSKPSYFSSKILLIASTAKPRLRRYIWPIRAVFNSTERCIELGVSTMSIGTSAQPLESSSKTVFARILYPCAPVLDLKSSTNYLAEAGAIEQTYVPWASKPIHFHRLQALQNVYTAQGWRVQIFTGDGGVHQIWHGGVIVQKWAVRPGACGPTR